MDSSKVKDNLFVVPFVARYVRIQPVDFKLRAALRLELMGCDLNSEVLPHAEGRCCSFIKKKNSILFGFFFCVLFSCTTGCSLPLGLQWGGVPDGNFDASSHYSYMFRSWLPNLARLNQGGNVNAWRPSVNTNTRHCADPGLSLTSILER